MSQTTSLCRTCKKTVPAELKREEGGIVMHKTCSEHGPPSAAVKTRVLAPHGHGTVGASTVRRTV